MGERATTEEQFCYYTEKAGDIARQLGFAGLALIWLLHAAEHSDGGIGVALDAGFRAPIILIVISLAVDALQYLVGSLLWGLAYRARPAEQAFANKGWNIAAIVVPCVLIAIKLGLMVAAYSQLLIHLCNSTLWTPGS